MAYTADDWRVQVRGDLPGGEIWVNTWTFRATDPGASIDDVGTAMHAFYDDLKSNFHNTLWKAVGATWKNLLGGNHGDFAWATITGTDGDDSLPNQDGIRVSLSGPGGVRGGPFLPGWDLGSLTATGMLNTTAVTDLMTALGTLNTSLQANDWAIAIDRPSVPSIVVATTARVGNRFDVIRRRANQQAESYSSLTL